MKSFYYGGSQIKFDFSDIRPKGALLVTSGGKAPGPQPLKECIVKIQGILNQKENGDKLTTTEVHDIVCYSADAVLLLLLLYCCCAAALLLLLGRG